jgi:hypothetical protein
MTDWVMYMDGSLYHQMNPKKEKIQMALTMIARG